MFPVDTLQPQYMEEQGAIYDAKMQRARQLAAVKSASTSCASTPAVSPSAISGPQALQGPCPKTLTTALLNRQQTARPSFFGNLIQGFSKPNSGAVTPALTRTSTPAKEKTQAEIDALIAEKKRDADIVSLHCHRLQ